MVWINSKAGRPAAKRVLPANASQEAKRLVNYTIPPMQNQKHYEGDLNV